VRPETCRGKRIADTVCRRKRIVYQVGNKRKINGYTMFRSSVKCTEYPLHSPVFPSLPLPCVTVCHHISTGLYSDLLDSTLIYTIPAEPPRSQWRRKRGEIIKFRLAL